MSIVHLKFGAGLTREQAALCYREGQKRWWIGRVASERRKPIAENGYKGYAAVDVKEYLKLSLGPATYPLDCTADLDFGCYVLGCGTGKAALRKFFVVDLMGVRWL